MNAFEQIKLPRRVNSNRLLLALSEKSICVAKSLFCINIFYYSYIVNVHDVNRIAIAYLNIWHKENLYSSITPQFFIKQFPELAEGIINSFFPISICLFIYNTK